MCTRGRAHPSVSRFAMSPALLPQVGRARGVVWHPPCLTVLQQLAGFSQHLWRKYLCSGVQAGRKRETSCFFKVPVFAFSFLVFV